MGCDIHLHIEVKINDKWEHYSTPSVKRFYSMFEKMAGVRGDIFNAISKPRGLPKDVSIITQLDYNCWRPDAHSMSWLNHDEIKILNKWLEGLTVPEGEYSFYYDLEHSILNCYFFSNSFCDLPSNVPEITDVRFVFWFDN